jgi:alanine racemase
VATIPLGYADGVPRRLSSTTDRPGGQVLIRGQRCPIVGTITMDQFMVDCGDLDVRAGEEVVLIGEQEGPRGIERITATDWADQLGTIGYEIVCGIGKRVPRVYIERP